ncbi:Uncharacterized protein dnm_094620 [Desulfonema magnum]|uniref:Uncharacterized protein n=2 Tax=Desulfonema magnum TaxID=45655 RepID=A0A975BX54_9BACT|nr:Uncharacterized protein dnm_094620 [Desulfonema magnum]
MIASQIQVSARVSPETKRMMDEYVQAKGEKETVLIETALLHHLQALRELPEDVVIPPRILVSEDSGIHTSEKISHKDTKTQRRHKETS